MDKKKIYIAHNSIKFIKNIENTLNDEEFILSGYALNGNEFVKIKNLDLYDVVIVKNALTNITGLYALEYLLNNTENRPGKMMLLTAFKNDFVNYKCEELGINHICYVETSAEKISSWITTFDNHKNMDGKYYDKSDNIIQYLKDIGIIRKYLGFKYLEYILYVLLEKKEYLHKSMQELYTIIATHFNVSSISVEKAIRSCLKSSFVNNDSSYASKIFGYNKNKKDYPSTSLFIQISIKTLKE